MPSYLDFNSTKSFRDLIIARTLNQPNGPQTFTATNYQTQNLSDFPVIYQGTVEDIRPSELIQSQTSNIYKPLQYFINDTIFTLPRSANLQLYPYFVSSNQSLLSIFTTDNFNSESELFKFAAHYIKDDRNGPLHSRIEQNLYTSTIGRLNLIDALNGNTSTAINLITGKEPLIEPNETITVSNSIVGQTIDFMETIAGVTIPVSKIPGNYLTDPANPTHYRPVASTEVGAVWQDVTGSLGSLVGIPRRPKVTDKPSDLLLQYTGDGQKKQLYRLLSFSKYAPNYTVSARSQQSSKIFQFADNFAEGVKNVLGIDATAVPGVAYVGDDRSNNLLNSMMDLNGIMYRSAYYMSLMFDPIQTDLLKRTTPIQNGGAISDKLTWISKNSSVKTAVFDIDNFTTSKSTNYTFRDDSLMAYTQSILNSMPSGGQARSHVGNVIDQTSKVFRESGDVMLSRGSAVKKFQYYNQKTGQETGVEYCRVWTKDTPFATFGDTMKKSGIYRKFYQGDSVLDHTYNLNIAPMSNGGFGDGAFAGSTNIVAKTEGGRNFYAKKYMFSIENLAWKTSTKNGFTVLDLPYCERGPNGGRVMWFPPYDLKVSESNTANWEKNSFIGRPEPIYTYQNTERSGTISFKVVVDHPSILNLLVREEFKSLSDEEADSYLNSFFAGCKDLDFYDIVKKYSTISTDDAKFVEAYLNQGNDPTPIDSYKTTIDPIKVPIPMNPQTDTKKDTLNLKFQNDIPSNTNVPIDNSNKSFTTLYNDYKLLYSTYLSDLSENVKLLVHNATGNTLSNSDLGLLFGDNYDVTNIPALQTKATGDLQKIFDNLDQTVKNYSDDTIALKADLESNVVQEININVDSSTSILNFQTTDYNIHLSYRRSYSILIDVLSKIAKDGVGSVAINKLNSSWKYNNETPLSINSITFKDLGYATDGKVIILVTNKGEDGQVDGGSGTYSCKQAKFTTRFKTITNSLSVVAPVSSNCRQANLVLSYVRTQTNNNNNNTGNNNAGVLPQTKITQNGKVTLTNQVNKPPIDVMKRIVMKTLSEQYYFKKLEETNSMLYKSVREKLKYFHPGFHSTTPEGLNSRLTFLQQCIRPGETMPIKGISDINDLNARNTSFGAPPICVIRIGDFYHSKIVINNVQITYDEGGGIVWDMNPEGIGMQPMIATVTLQCNFIGGQGLSKPVERLQNALSSNFYANTEMYDERSTSTLSGNDLKKYEDYTKQFIDDLNKRNKQTADSGVSTPPVQKDISKNTYIGDDVSNSLSYTKLVQSIYDNTKNYFNSYKQIVEILMTKYDNDLPSLLLSNKYRTIKNYDVNTDVSTTLSLELLGLYPVSKDSTVMLDNLESVLTQSVTLSPTNVTNMFSDLSNDLLGINFNTISSTDSATLTKLSDERLQPFIISQIKTMIDNLRSEDIKSLGEIRNTLISSLDKVNFLVKNAHDAFIGDSDPYKSELTGFTSTSFYGKYSDVISFIRDNHNKLTNDISTTYDFVKPSLLTKDQIKNLIGIFLKGTTTAFLNLYSDNPIFTKNIKNKLSKSYDKFTVVPNIYTLKDFKFKDRKDNKEIIYSPLNFERITDNTVKTDIININSDIVEPINNKLNFYKTKK